MSAGAEPERQDSASLRALIQDCVLKHLLPTAALMGETLVEMGTGDPADVCLLADVYYRMKQYKRALVLLDRHASVCDADLNCRYVKALCLYDSGQHEECLNYLDERSEWLNEPAPTSLSPVSIDLIAALHLLRGRAQEALDRRSAAGASHSAALLRDPRLGEALLRLTEGALRPPADIAALLRQVGGAVGRVRSPAAAVAAAAAQAVDYGLYDDAVRMCAAALEKDPYDGRVLPPLLAALVQLGRTTELFTLAHRLSADGTRRGRGGGRRALLTPAPAASGTALAWHAVGCYYLASRRPQPARRAFVRATVADSSFAPGWIAYGHTFAAAQDSDNAQAAYRTAARLFPGSAVPLLCMATEFLTAQNLPLAHQHFLAALALAPADPHALHGLGVVAYRSGRVAEAAERFTTLLALVAAEGAVPPAWEPAVFNLGHCFRKLRRYAEAVAQYELALSLVPGAGSTYAALGFTYHLAGNVAAAIEYYHKALGLVPDDTFTTEMLSRALEEETSAPLP